MQFKIPQDVQRADTIIGSVTFLQLGLLLIGGGLSYALYMVLSPLYYWYVYIWPVGLVAVLTLASAFLKIGDMTFTKYILYMIEFLGKPRARIWKKGDMEYFHSVLKPLIPVSKANDLNKSFAETESERSDKLKELTEILDK
jgi:hypothetical protein